MDQTFLNNDWNHFKKGFPVKRLNQEPEKEMRLAYSPNEKHGCNATLHIDSRDFFYATPNFHDFQTVTLPNPKEFNLILQEKSHLIYNKLALIYRLLQNIQPDSLIRLVNS